MFLFWFTYLHIRKFFIIVVYLTLCSDYKGIEGMLDVLSDWGEGVISICNSSFSTLPTVLTKVFIFVFSIISPDSSLL